MNNFKELQEKYEFDVYPKRDLVLVSGKNSKVYDENGKEYIDLTSGHGVASIGHCNEKVINAVKEQMGKLITCSGTFFNDRKAELLERLIEITSPNLHKAFLCNSGTESVEAALKFARYTTGREKFICAMRSFHGRTMGALSATYQPAYKKPFEPVVPGFEFVPFNNFERLRQSVENETAAIVLEIVQGEGGVHIGERGYLENVEKLCKEKNVLLILDEIQTGFCRTGKMFAYEHFDIEPDILCLAKAMGGGLPIGAVVCSEKIKVPKGLHGSTFGGNPLVCSAALAAIQYMIDNNLDTQASEKGVFITEKLKKAKLQNVKQVRNLGLMIGIELKEKVKPYIDKLIKKGVLTLPAGGTVLRLLPPLIIGYDELEIATNEIIKVLNSNPSQTPESEH